MQTQEGKVDMVTTLDAGLVVTESSGMESGKQDESIRSGNVYNVVEKNDLSKQVTSQSWPKVREYAFAKPHYVIAPGSSRNSSKSVSSPTTKESVGFK
ncbi:hypothetical protein Tco_1265683 [Tanacetum coccineum]